MKVLGNPSVTERITQLDIEITKIFKARKSLKTHDLCSLVGISKSGAANAMKRFQDKRLIHVEKIKGHNVWHWGSSQTNDEPKYNKKFRSTGIYTGSNWNPEIARPKCLDFLKCPSRYGNERVAHRPMMHGMTSSIRQPSQFDR